MLITKIITELNYLFVVTLSLFCCLTKLQEAKVPVSFLTSLVFKFIENIESIIESRLGKKNEDNANY